MKFKHILIATLISLFPHISHADMVVATLIDHVSPVTQIKNGETKLALVDSVIQIGSYNGKSIFDLQAGFSGETAPQSGEVAGANLVVGGFFKVSSLMNGHVHFPEHWAFLKAVEHGVAYTYDFREKRDYVSYQIGLAFALQPK